MGLDEGILKGNTLKRKEEVIKLNRLIRKEANLPEDLLFSSIQINRNMKAHKHVDERCEGVAAILAVGEFEGGEMKWSPEGQPELVTSVRNNWVLFNASTPHETVDFVGDRICIIVYLEKPRKETPPTTLTTLDKLGFRRVTEEP